MLCTARSSLLCSAGGEGDEGPNASQPSPPVVRAELPHQPGFSHPRLAQQKKIKIKIRDSRVIEVHN